MDICHLIKDLFAVNTVLIISEVKGTQWSPLVNKRKFNAKASLKS